MQTSITPNADNFHAVISFPYFKVTLTSEGGGGGGGVGGGGVALAV